MSSQGARTVLVVTRNDYQHKCIECNYFDNPIQTIKLKHKFEFFPVSKHDLILLHEEVNGKEFYLSSKPGVVARYVPERFNDIWTSVFFSLKSHPDSNFLGDIKGILTWKTFSLIKAGLDREIFDVLLEYCELKRVKDIEILINNWMGDYETLVKTQKYNPNQARDYINLITLKLIDEVTRAVSNRRLFLMGLSKEEIQSLPLRQTEVYLSLIEKRLLPFAFSDWSFDKCLLVANNCGWALSTDDCDVRINYEFNKMILTKCCESGDTYIPTESFKRLCQPILDNLNRECDVELTQEQVISELVKLYGISETKEGYQHLYLKNHEDRCYSFLERQIENNLNDQKETTNSESPDHLSEEQAQGYRQALKYHLSILTGGAGTGKTTTISAIVNRLLRDGYKVQCTAFTGKAVARMKETIQFASNLLLEPLTMDRLCYQSEKTEFDYLVIDEASMVTIELFSRFLRAHQFPFRTLMVGDINQLKSIGVGEIFSIMFKTCAIPITRLHRNFRVQSLGHLLPNIHSVSTGACQLQYSNPDDEHADFISIPTKAGNNSTDYDIIRKLLIKLKEQGLPSTEIRILSFFKEPLIHLNKIFLEVFFGIKTSKKAGLFVPEQEILITRNINEYSLFNGTPGRVLSATDNEVEVVFPDRESRFTFVNSSPSKNNLTLNDLESAYCTTIHKSQGSEYNTVILYCQHRDKDPGDFLQINLLYTAISRAKDCLYIIGDQSQIERAARNVGKNRLELISDQIRKKFKIEEEYVEYVEMIDDDDDDFDDF